MNNWWLDITTNRVIGRLLKLVNHISKLTNLSSYSSFINKINLEIITIKISVHENKIPMRCRAMDPLIFKRMIGIIKLLRRQSH